MREQKLLERLRVLRSKYLENTARFLLKAGLTANWITLLSFFCGIIAAYFLFTDHLLFMLFAALHLLGDGIDGVVARLGRPDPKGKYYDHLNDHSISLILLLKIFIYLEDYYVLLVIAMFLISQAVYLFSRLTYPVLLFRSMIMIILAFFPVFASSPVAAYLLAGICSVYSLISQLNYFLKTRSFSS